MGGIFDPIHFGHLLLAESASEAFQFDKVLFIPAFTPPHRADKPKASFKDRCLMVRLAIEGNDRFEISDLEKDLKSPGYTLAVVDYLRLGNPAVDLTLILGADNIVQFDRWHKPEDLIQRVRIAVGMRPGYESAFRETPWAEKVDTFPMPLIDISSNQIRKLIGAGKSARYFLPEEVRQFILSKGLYK
jgi:nicotinate-nucleotide adenylyltransferase